MMSTALSYGDVLLRWEDVSLLEGRSQWLNDQLLAFYFEYIIAEVHPQHRQQLLLVPGAATYLMLTCGAEMAGAVLQPLGFGARRLSLFAVNNNPDAEVAGGGSHWSLLSYYAPDNTFRHYDSCAGVNAAAARSLYRALQPCVPPNAALAELPTPQQRNGYDCGVFALAIARLLCQRATSGDGAMDFRVAEADQGADAVSQAAVTALRQELHTLILERAAAQGHTRRNPM